MRVGKPTDTEYFTSRLIDSNLEQKERESPNAPSDPVLSAANLGYRSSQRLLEEIVEAGTDRSSAKAIVKQLCQKASTAIREVTLQATSRGDSNPLRKGDRIELEQHNLLYTLVYRRKRWKKPFCVKINKSHYDKLKSMFRNVHQGSELSGMALHVFHLIVFVLLIRYSAISGGQLLMDLRGGGMQGAVHGELFGVLSGVFPDDILLEGFGSPLNCHLPTFGSAFEDLDWHFGSIGSFLSLSLCNDNYCCEANPPFSPGLMNAMAQRMNEQLVAANQNESCLTFVVIVPSTSDVGNIQRAAAKRFGGESLQRMLNSSFCRRHILLKAKEHGYVEGAQHLRPTKYKESLYDTSVIVLQSSRARERKLDVEKLESDVRGAFESRHRAETERRAQEHDVGVDEVGVAPPN